MTAQSVGWISYWQAVVNRLRRAKGTPTRSGDREILFYRNPMNPTVTSPVPSKDEMGMDYLPVYADEVGQADDQGPTVNINPTIVQNMNVQTAMVERRDLNQEIRTVGYLEYDQERMVTVTTKYSGWVEKVYVNYVGEPVEKGQPLFEIYSPELVQTEQELLSAIEYAEESSTAPAHRGWSTSDCPGRLGPRTPPLLGYLVRADRQSGAHR